MTDETKHTPGPWEITEGIGMDEAWCNWHKVGPFDLMGGRAGPDSHLISAAPDMLEALKAMLLNYGPPLDSVLYPKSHAISLAREAISKAEGRSK